MASRLDKLLGHVSKLDEKREKVKQDAANAKMASAQQSAQIASRLNNPVSSPVIRTTQGANIASRLDGGTYAANSGRQAEIVRKAEEYKRNTESAQVASRLDNVISSPSLQASRSAQAAANLDNSLMGQATRDKTQESLNEALNSIYNRMEGYKNNGQTEELARAERQYKLLDESLQRSKIVGTMNEAAEWETQRRNEIMSTDDRYLMPKLDRLIALKEAKMQEAGERGDDRRNGLTETEKQYNAIYNSLKAQYGDQVDGWLEYAKRMDNQSKMAEKEEKAKQAAEDKPFWSSVGSVPLNLASGAGYLDVVGQKMQRSITGSNAPIDYNSPAQSASKMTNTIRSTVSEDMSGVGSFLYNTVMSMGDTLLAMPLGNVGMALLGGSAATNAMQEAVDRGATDNQALAVGLVAGGLEAVMEKMSIDSLFNLTEPKAVRDVVINALKQGGSEGAEEGLTTLANTVADVLIMGDKNALAVEKQNLIAAGYSAAEAEKIANKNWAKNLALDTLGGVLSGGVFGSVKSGIDYSKYKSTQNLVDSAMPKVKQEQAAQTIPESAVDSAMPKMQQEQATAQPVQPPTQATPQQRVTEAISQITGQNKNASVTETETESTAVNTNPAAHTPQEQAVIEEYQDAVDAGLVQFAQQIQAGTVDANKVRYTLSPVSTRAALDIQRISGVDTTGFSTVIEGRMLDHTIKRHGENGTADHSLRDLNDIGRMQYVIDHYDNISDGGTTKAYTTNKPNGKPGLAKTVVFEKAVNGTYYVVEAVPDTKAKTTYVVSAYMSKKGTQKNGAKQLTDTTSAPVLTAETGFAQTPNPNIVDNPENVNGEKPAMGAADSGFDPYSHASIEHGAIPPGENPARVVDVPKSVDGESNVMQTVRTIMEADATPDAAIPELERAIVKGKFSKMPITDQAASERAESTIRQVGYQTALADWRAEVRSGRVSKDSVALGEALYNAAVNAKDYKSAVKIAVELSTQVRSAAQALQAIRMLKKLSPSAQLYGVKQSVDNLQDTLTKKYGKRAPDLVINEELAANFLAAETDADRTAAEEALYKDIARQIPATFTDKWNAWRYLSMLGNVRTHVRNVSGNAMFAPVRAVKNKVGAGLEAGAQLVGIIDKSQRTKALAPAGRDLMKAAKADYQNVEKQVLSAGKYNSASDIIEENRRIFKGAVAETLRRGNSKLLDLEDSVFSKQAYAASLASYLKAQGFTASDFTGDGMTNRRKNAARAYAIKEAQKATYRDINDFSEAISSIGFKNPGDSKTKKVLNSAIEGVMPFKKTPANILVRGMEYSPAGLAKALSTDIYAVANGKITAAEYMDRLASGLTGTGLFALGCFLSNSGFLVGGSPEDEDRADLEGRQPYSLEVGDKSITLDWLAPEAMPVFMGVELMEAIREGGGDAPLLDKVLSFAKGLSGPMLEMSMMSSLQDALEATEYADNKLLAFMANGALGYLKQALPTVFGQLERSLGSAVRETTFTQQGDKLLTKDAQYMVGSVANKIPGWDYNQIPYIDAWGRTEDQGNTGTRLFNNMLNPAYVSTIQETPVDAEIKRLETETGVNLTPSRAQSILTIDGKKEILTANEYVTYAQAKGQNDLTFRQNLIDSDAYKALDDKTKVKVMEYSKELANALAIKEAGFNDPNMPEWQKELIGADAETITRVLTEKAVNSQAGMLGENKYLGLENLLETKSIDDQMALACMSNSCYEAYTTNCEKAGISVQQFLDAYGTASANGETSAEKKQAALDYIATMDISAEQKGALAQAVHEAIGTFAPVTTEIPEQYLLDIGDIGRIESQMGEDQREKYDTYIKGSDVEMQTYLDMMEFYGSDEAKTQYDANGKAIDGEETKDHMEEYIRSLDISDADKGRLYCGLYSEKTCPKDLLIAALGTEAAEAYISDARKEGYEKYVKGTEIDLLTYFDLVDYYNSSESDGKKDANGKTIKGESKQDHVIAWINALDLTDKEKGRLFCSLYAEKNCPRNWR